MRATNVRMSEMPGPKVYNQWWGDKSSSMPQRGVIQYTWSPFRARACKNFFTGYLFNGYRRLSENAPYWIIPFAVGYGTYTWAKRYDEFINSKAGHLAGYSH